MIRKLHLTGRLDVVDDEIGRDEEFQTSFNHEKVVSSREPVEVFDPKFEFKCGGEIRVEITLRASVLANGQLLLQGMMYLYEGATEETKDLDGFGPIIFAVQPNQTTTRYFSITNWERRSHDTASLKLTCSNTSAE